MKVIKILKIMMMMMDIDVTLIEIFTTQLGLWTTRFSGYERILGAIETEDEI